ncbi:MAG TPA: hypothetical protein VJN62_06905 [Gemmatimonadales bacterium]|nr:hypothetical protein [Gemmatimonadales bacterium]
MRWSQLGIVSTLVLMAPMCAVQGQRLPPTFTPTNPAMFSTPAQSTSSGLALVRPSHDCRMSPVLVVALEMAGGAVAGLISYELVGGIYIAAEGATSQPFARDLRYSLMAAGAVLGAIRGISIIRGCHRSAGP